MTDTVSVEPSVEPAVEPSVEPAQAPSIPRQAGDPITRGMLELAAADTWQQLLSSSLHPGYMFHRSEVISYAVSASVSLVGNVSLVAVLSAPVDVAVDAAVRVLGLERDELAPGDIDDAFAELVLTVGDRLRDRLPGLVRLGHPSVVQGRELTTALPGARLAAEAILGNSAGHVRLSAWRPKQGRWPAAG